MLGKEQIFTEGNVIRSKATGKIYTVKKSDLGLGFAFVADQDENLRAIDWYYAGAGVINDKVLNSYELVQSVEACSPYATINS